MQVRGKGVRGILLASLPLSAFCLNPFRGCLQNSNFLVKVSSLCIAFGLLSKVSFKENDSEHISQSPRERAAELRKEGHRSEPEDMNAKLLTVSE